MLCYDFSFTKPSDATLSVCYNKRLASIEFLHKKFLLLEINWKDTLESLKKISILPTIKFEIVVSRFYAYVAIKTRADTIEVVNVRFIAGNTFIQTLIWIEEIQARYILMRTERQTKNIPRLQKTTNQQKSDYTQITYYYYYYKQHNYSFPSVSDLNSFFFFFENEETL